jgi:hypothetical protein
LGALLSRRLLGRVGARSACLERFIRREGAAQMLIARIIMAVAILNLVFLFSELTMNVVRVYFG